MGFKAGTDEEIAKDREKTEAMLAEQRRALNLSPEEEERFDRIVNVLQQVPAVADVAKHEHPAVKVTHDSLLMAWITDAAAERQEAQMEQLAIRLDRIVEKLDTSKA